MLDILGTVSRGYEYGVRRLDNNVIFQADGGHQAAARVDIGVFDIMGQNVPVGDIAAGVLFADLPQGFHEPTSFQPARNMIMAPRSVFSMMA